LPKQAQSVKPLTQYYEAMLATWGPQHWWPADSPWEVAVGAILTQNTNWRNVERAIANLRASNSLEVDCIIGMENDALAMLIRSAGYFNLKAKRLKALAVWWQEYETAATDMKTEALRQSLLSINGVGEETADSILVYAFGRARFVVDTYTRRLVTRHGLLPDNASYRQIQALFEDALSPDNPLCNEFHALIVQLGKHHCKPTPKCESCPLSWDLPQADKRMCRDTSTVRQAAYSG
jgi:endonuclease-3 related protein